MLAAQKLTLRASTHNLRIIHHRKLFRNRSWFVMLLYYRYWLVVSTPSPTHLTNQTMVLYLEHKRELTSVVSGVGDRRVL
jgi:hypothetical protein